MALDPNYIMDDGDDYRKNDMISLAFDIHEFFINKGFTYDEIKLDNVNNNVYRFNTLADMYIGLSEKIIEIANKTNLMKKDSEK